MGCSYLVKLTDAVLFLFFIIFATSAPFQVQVAFPCDHYPKQLVDLNARYVNDFGGYLFSESPHWFVALIRVQLLLLWPLSIANLFGSATGKSWYHTTCLIFGVSFFTSMSAIVGELVGSGRSSEKLLILHYTFLGAAVLASLRGLIRCGQSACSTVAGTPAKKHAVERKKRA